KQKEVINKVQQKDKKLHILSYKFIQSKQIAKLQSDKFHKYKAIEIEDAIYNTIRYFRKESAKKLEELRKLKQQIKQYREDQEAKK
ncbi:20550_t:CDS:2, partial [Racocetra persica]